MSQNINGWNGPGEIRGRTERCTIVSSISGSEMGKEAMEGRRQESTDAQVRQQRKECTDRGGAFISIKAAAALQCRLRVIQF